MTVPVVSAFAVNVILLLFLQFNAVPLTIRSYFPAGKTKTFDLGVIAIVVGVFTAIAFFVSLTVHLVGGFSLGVVILRSAINVAEGVIVLLFGIYCVHQNESEDGLSRKGWFFTVGAMVLLHAFFQYFIYLETRTQTAIFPKGGLPYSVLTFFIRGAAILCAVLAYEVFLRKKRLRAKHDESLLLSLAYRDSEISRLKAQLSPHFLFNALGAVAAEAERPRMVEQLVGSLSNVLRYNLSHTTGNAALGKEVVALRSYLQMEQVRLGDALRVEFDLTPLAHAILVPQPLLLPLVENAIKYGRETSGEILTLKIGAKVQERHLTLWVENSGRWVEPAPAEAGRQLGLANLKRRLNLQIGPAEYLKVDALPGAVRVSIMIPTP